MRQQRAAQDFDAYRATCAAAPPPPRPHWPVRPDGECVWIHLGNCDDLPAILDLADRLHTQRGSLTVVITYLTDQKPPDFDAIAPSADIIFVGAPHEHPQAVHAFLDYWSPDVALWVWGNLRPNLICEAHTRDIPMHLVSAEKAGFDGWQHQWTRDMARTIARCFSSASARSAGGAQRLARFGVPADLIAVWPPLRPSGRVLTCAPEDLDDLSNDLNARPVWLAADVPENEWRSVLDAHRIALRSAHRLLLVLNVNEGVDPDPIRAELHQDGLFHATWSDGAPPEETTQVLIADLPGELGLWFRVAAVSYLGGTLFQGPGGQDPMVPASLGTAILHGPNTSQYSESFSRLRSAGAIELVQDAQTLGAAVARNIAAERAAQMALAGWDVVSEGAETVDAVIDLVQDSLDGPVTRGPA